MCQLLEVKAFKNLLNSRLSMNDSCLNIAEVIVSESGKILLLLLLLLLLSPVVIIVVVIRSSYTYWHSMLKVKVGWLVF